jgi:uncharacterized membrane protein
VSVEQLLRQAMHGADTYEVSPDLFARVKRSIDEDRAHRRRVRMAVAWSLTGVLAVALYLGAMAEVVDGRVTWPWWSLELLTAVLMIVLILVIGPLIRRFGGIFAASVFTANRPTATHFLRVLDVAYYLTFSAFVAIEIRIVPRDEWLGPDGTAVHLDWVAGRIGVLLLLMGVLHAITIALLPVLGVVFSSIWRQLTPGERRAAR